MNEETFLSKISQLENEIEYLHGLLDNAGISYKRKAKELEELSPDKNLAFEENQGARILPVTITKQHIQYYYHLFKGRNDVYSKRSGKANKKTGKHGYYTQCWNFWKDGICPKKNNPQFNCGECQNQKYKELTGQVLYEHLIGAREDASDVIGLYPMFPDETVNFLVFDFDCHDDKIGGDDGANFESDWMTEVNAFRKICEINEVPVLVERSRSGKGAHVWIFFEKPILASVARRFGTALLSKGAESVNMRSFKYYDRMLPAQDHIPLNTKTGKPGLGNLIALPLQGQALKLGNSAFIDENWNAYPNQWECLKEVKKLSSETVEERIKEWSAEGILGVLSNEFEADTEGANDTKPWEKTKPSLHKEDVSSAVEIIIADKVYVGTKDMKPRMQNALRRMSAFSNPDFYKKAAMGLSTKCIPRIVFCGYDDAGYICIPRALLDSVIDRFNEVDISFTLTDNRCTGMTLDVSFNGTLYEEQMRAAKAILEHDNGILAATTSFGKTVVGAYMIAQRKTNTLILVHNTEIQKNWIEDLNKFLDVNAELPEYKTKTGRIKKRKSLIGKLHAGHNSMTGIIDVAIFSSLGKGDEINPMLEQYGMVIMDECHHGAAQTVEDVVGSAKAKYVYGLTATPKREDGLEKKVFMQFGPIRFRYTAKERAEKQGIDHFVYPRFTMLVSTANLKVMEANRAVIECESRNEQIIADVENCIQNGRTPLVLTKYKEHAELLYQRLQGKADHVYLLQGGGSRKAKDKMRIQMRAISDAESIVLVAIDKYIGEGFNFPRLDTMMLTMPAAAEGNIEQFAGRLHRDYETKKEVIIYDYVDSHIRVLEKMYHKRLRTYKKIGYEICNNINVEKQNANTIFDIDSYEKVYEKDLLEANKEIIISSPGINHAKLDAFVKLINQRQEDGIKLTVITLNPEGYPEEKIEDTKRLVEILKNCGIRVKLQEHMHEHFAIIDDEIVWYGSMNFLSRAKADDNLMRVKSKDVAQELLERSFG
ncbi:TOTE conflict system archaeo-eukaryotic primase domain-containing protein [Oribacterium sp. oral taxon 108]|uniref:TOTE conflict system archaeo-eukaryotic primase domain-containing protein n=1 Tax=Oribacterium sp. oral taxon 108 TaxID=712414 RepID=UPI00020DD4CD|nr:DEAD/DEAH box helicase family protein [Oribacterium sp. oral taxon 108]EGL38262.1 DNA primase small subunit [Oribacterium sp. oral taxon 108 str. F0425]